MCLENINRIFTYQLNEIRMGLTKKMDGGKNKCVNSCHFSP